MSRSRIWVVGLLCCAFLYCPTSAVSSDAAQLPVSEDFATSLVVPSVQALDGGQQTQDAAAARLANPVEVSLREESQTMFEGLTAEEAASVAAKELPSAIDAPGGGVPSLGAGATVTGFLSDTTARVDLGEGKHAVLESTVPIAKEDDSGQFSGLNLALHEGGSGFVPAASLVQVQAAKSVSEGIVLGSTGVSVTPVDANGAPSQGATGRIDGASAFYANTQSDTDTAVKPTSLGFDLLSVLRSARSPQRLAFKVGMPAGAKLVAAPYGASVRVDMAGQTIAVIRPPVAEDAAGSSVPVSMQIVGQSIVLSVDEPAGAYRFPIVVDPTVVDYKLLGAGAASNWKAVTTNGGVFHFAEENERELVDSASGEHAINDYGEFAYDTQGTSRIYEFTAGTFAWDETPLFESETQSRNFLYIFNNKLETEEWLEMPGKYSIVSHKICAKASCSSASGSAGNAAVFRQLAILKGSERFEGLLVESAVSLFQEAGPTSSMDTADPSVNGYPNASNGQWVNPEISHAVIATVAKDSGIGIYKATVTSPQELPYLNPYKVDYEPENGCSGAQCYQCWDVSSRCESGTRPDGLPVSSDEPLTFGLEVPELGEWHGWLPDGEDTVTVTAENATGAKTSSTGTVRIDTKAPTEIKIQGLPSGNEIGEGVTHVTAEATDGSGSTPSSGVAQLALTVDGKEVGKPNGTCSPGRCTAKGEWSVNGSEFGAGIHTLAVTATDAAGNSSSQTVTLTIHEPSAISDGPGSINPQSGEFRMQSGDVSVGGLSVTRDYSSQHLGTEEQSPLGPQWGISLTSDEHMTEQPNGNVVLRDASGNTTTFTYNGSEFTAPKGDNNITLTPNSEGYVLHNAAAHTETSFTQPENSSYGTPTYAGSIGAAGVANGDLKEPRDVAVDSSGHLWVTDTFNNRVEEFNSEGQYVGQFGSLGSGQGEFHEPFGIAVSKTGEKWVTDYGNHRVQRFGSNNEYLGQTPKEGPGYVFEPAGVAIDSKGNAWVVDAGNNHLVEYNKYGEYIKTLGGLGSGNGQFNDPLRVTIDSKGDLWVTDANNHRVQEFNEKAEYVKTIGSQGTGNGQFETPVGIQVDAKGDIWVSDFALNRVQEFNEKGEFVTTFGTAGSGPGQFGGVHSVAIASKGTLWVVDGGNNRLQRWMHSTWVPTISQGVAPTDRTTYSYVTKVLAGKSVTEPLEALAPKPTGVTCAGEIGELKRGCRALSFNYATSTTASGEGPSQWGDYEGRLTRVYYTAWNPETSAMKTVTVAQYSYDTQGRLRAEWDPRVSPVLKTEYGYDTEGRLTAVTPPGQQPWTINYGTLTGNTTPGRTLSTTRAGVLTPSWKGEALSASVVPTLSSGEASVGTQLEATSNGTWSGEPVSYAYQWLDCAKNGGIGMVSGCLPIAGAKAQTYTPTTKDRGYGIAIEVRATSPGGTVGARSAVTSVIAAGTVRYATAFGSLGSGSGQMNEPTGVAVDATGDVWVVDSKNSRIDEFSSTGSFVRMFGSNGSGAGQFNVPQAVAVSPVSGNVFVADDFNNRIQVFTPQGVYITSFGSAGAGNGQFKEPKGIAVDSNGNVWVADRSNNRVQEFSEYGLYLTQFGTNGTGNGQFKFVNDVTVCGGAIYAVDYEDQRVEEFTPTGTYVTQFGSAGTGNGQFTQIVRVGCDATSRVLYASDKGGNRVEAFNLGGDYLGSVGSAGSSGGQMSAPIGLAVNASGGLYVADSANNRVQEWTAPYLAYSTSFGTAGSGNGQFNTPTAIAIDSSKNVWVDDTSNHRIQEFSSSGSYLKAFGSLGTGNSQFNTSEGLAISPSNGNIYTSDAVNNRLQQFTSTGEFVRSFGTSGSENGQVSEPHGLTVDSSGNVWVADYKNNRVEEFSSTGTYLSKFGTSGSGNGQFSGPNDVTYCGGYLYVSDYGNQRIEKFSTSGTYQTQFGTSGSNNGQFSQVSRLGCDSTNSLIYASDKGTNNRVEVFTLSGGFVGAFGSTGSGTSQLSSPYGIAISSSGTAYVVDGANNRITEWTPFGITTEPAQNPPSAGTNSVTTIDYNVPLSGTGLPTMTESEVAKWGQTDVPLEATAVFPPDEPQGWPASDYKRATLYYFDNQSHTVNIASPSGAIATTEYNSNNDVVRSLSPDNRVLAVKEGGKAYEHLDTQSTYNSEGTELLSTLGPRHTVKLANGKEVQARSHTVYSYDEGAPETGGPYRLVTKTTQGAQIEGEPEQDVRTTRTYYSGQNGLGWKLRQPTSTVTDPSGLDLIHTTLYDEATGNVIETRAPAGSSEKVYPLSYSLAFGKEGTGTGQFKAPMADAVDPTGDVWVVDKNNHRVEKFSPTGSFIGAYGAEGTIGGDYGEAWGIAINQTTGNVYVTDSSNNRIEELNSSGAFIETIGWGVSDGKTELEICKTSCRAGLSGGGNGQLNYPIGISIDGKGDLWIADDGNNRIQEISEAGAYVTKFGSYGTGNGQFNGLRGIAIDEGEIYAVDKGNDRVQEFNPAGTYLGQFGNKGTGEGQFESPAMIAVNPNNSDIYVSEPSEEKIEEFSPAGKFLVQFGMWGSGAGQFENPTGLAMNTSGDLYVTEEYGDRVSEMVPPGANGAHMTYYTQFGSEGAGEGQFYGPTMDAIDGTGNLWVTDENNSRVEKFSNTGKYLASYGKWGTGEVQFKKPSGIAINQSTGNVYIADCENNRIEEISATGTYIRAFGTAGTGNGQFKCPGGVKIDSSGNVWVADTQNNRIQEFTSTGTFTAAYGKNGTGNGEFKEPTDIAISGTNIYIVDSGNNHVQKLTTSGVYVTKFGSEGNGGGQFFTPNSISVDASGHLYVTDSGNARAEEFTANGEFLASFATEGSGEGQLKKPDGIAIDAAGNAYIADSGNDRIQQWANSNQAVHDTKTAYYTSGTEASITACQNHPEWANLPCQTEPAAQPNTPGVPSLPVTTITYNMLGEPATATNIVTQCEKVTPGTGKYTNNTCGTSGTGEYELHTYTRTSTTTYDEAGRALTNHITATVGGALPTVTEKYQSTTGAPNEQSITVGSEVQSIKTTFNAVGEMTSYADSDGNTTKYEYEGEENYKGSKERDGRLRHMDDGKGTKTYSYDETTGLLKELSDLQGTHTLKFIATYDAEGNMTTESLPNGMNANYTTNQVGESVGLSYEKTTHCTTGCVWLSDNTVPTIHGQSATQESTLASETYSYDEAGRLTKVLDNVSGEGCTTRIYGYDEETNRTSLTTRNLGSEGSCAPEGGTVQTHTYDNANRLTDEGITYNPFGETTKLTAGDAGGYELTSSFYTDGQLEGQTQHGQTIGYQLDAEQRPHETIDTGIVNATITSHYAGPGDSPSWTVEPTSGHWTRYVQGISGLAAIEKDTEEPILQLTDLQGNIIARASISETATKLLGTERTTEYGVPTSTKPEKYSWLGGDQRATELSSGVVAMGARSYVPEIGRFLQTDPIPGGSANAYAYTYGDPVGETDISGDFTEGGSQEDLSEGAISAETRTAQEQAARAEAEGRARSECPIASMCVMPEEGGIEEFEEGPLGIAQWAQPGGEGAIAVAAMGGCPSEKDPCWKDVQKNKVKVDWLTRKSSGCRSGYRDRSGKCVAPPEKKNLTCTEENVASFVGGAVAATLFPVTTPFALLGGGVDLLECGIK